MAKAPVNLAASARARLLALSKATGQTFDLVLTRFALERLLYRLSQSQHAEKFVLKGAMLLTTWFDDPMRPTRDIVLLGFGDPDSAAMLDAFHDIMSIEVADGIVFDVASLRIDRIREMTAMAVSACGPTRSWLAPEYRSSSISVSATPSSRALRI